jgi:tripartite ATP-independent transporter DctM subunit
MEYLALLMFVVVAAVLLTGYPVALVLGGSSLLVALLGIAIGGFDASSLLAMPNRLYGIMTNATLLAVPQFVFMGVMLERSRVADQLLDTMARLFGPVRGGLGISVVLVGALLAASTGIVGATVVTMGLLSLPTMLKRGYNPAVAAGTICASGTLGQIIPPSIILVLLGDVLSSAYQQAQLNQGIYAPETVSVGDLFAGAIFPGLLLVGLYLIYILLRAWLRPQDMPSVRSDEQADASLWLQVVKVLLPPLFLIVAVLGSILAGFATPTEAASVGAMGAILLAWLQKQLSLVVLQEVMRSTLQITSMVFLIFIGASIFSLVFRGFGGDHLVESILTNLPGGVVGAMILVMVLMFLLGFILDFIEITFVVVPIVAPILMMMGIDPIWLGIMIAINLQTSFLTPPFGFALFYLRGVAPAGLQTMDIYRGVIPFIAIQVLAMLLLVFWPELATWLPGQIQANS